MVKVSVFLIQTTCKFGPSLLPSDLKLGNSETYFLTIILGYISFSTGTAPVVEPDSIAKFVALKTLSRFHTYIGKLFNYFDVCLLFNQVADKT